jgi:hypothetical protein
LAFDKFTADLAPFDIDHEASSPNASAIAEKPASFLKAKPPGAHHANAP